MSSNIESQHLEKKDDEVLQAFDVSFMTVRKDRMSVTSDDYLAEDISSIGVQDLETEGKPPLSLLGALASFVLGCSAIWFGIAKFISVLLIKVSFWFILYALIGVLFVMVGLFFAFGGYVSIQEYIESRSQALLCITFKSGKVIKIQGYSKFMKKVGDTLEKYLFHKTDRLSAFIDLREKSIKET